MKVTYFRPQREGPEIAIQNAVLARMGEVVSSADCPVWMAGSLPIGAGMPDLVAVSYEPEVVALARVGMPSADVLAYLRAVNRARLNTIVERISRPRTTIVRCIDGLLEVEAVVPSSEGRNDTFALTPLWRSILPEIVTVEAKVADWRKATAQAARNTLFAHRSYIALPDRIALKVYRESVFGHLGVGVLAVTEKGAVRVCKRARRGQPKIWTYYYKLASFAAAYAGEKRRCRTSSQSKKRG